MLQLFNALSMVILLLRLKRPDTVVVRRAGEPIHDYGADYKDTSDRIEYILLPPPHASSNNNDDNYNHTAEGGEKSCCLLAAGHPFSRRR